MASTTVMDHAFTRWGVLIAGLVVTGSIAWWAVDFLYSPRGIPGPGIADAISPASAAFALLTAFLLCGVVATIVGRLLNPVVGLFTLGAGFAVTSMRSGTIRDAAFDGVSLVPLAIEGLVWALLVAAVSIMVHRNGRDTPSPAERASTAPGPALPSVAAAFAPGALKAALFGVLALLGIWLLVTSPLKGQAIGAVVIGGLLAGHVARRAAPEMSPVLLFAAPILFVAIAQLIVAFSIGDPAVAFVQGAIPNLSTVMPLDLVSGTLVGVAIGIGLAKPG